MMKAILALLKREPARVAGMLGSVVAFVIATFGLHLSSTQASAVAAIPLVVSEITRFQVSPAGEAARLAGWFVANAPPEIAKGGRPIDVAIRVLDAWKTSIVELGGLPGVDRSSGNVTAPIISATSGKGPPS